MSGHVKLACLSNARTHTDDGRFSTGAEWDARKVSDFGQQEDHSGDHGDCPDWERQSKEETRDGALHAAVVKVSGGRGESLSNPSEPSGQQPVTPGDGQQADRDEQDSGGHDLLRGVRRRACGEPFG